MRARGGSFVRESVGLWGWYSFAYWASSCLYPVSAEIWWLNQFGCCAVACVAIAAASASGLLRGHVVRAVDGASLVGAMAASIALSQDPLVELPEPMLVLAVALVGFFMGWSVFRWTARYAALDAKENLILVLVSVIMISVIKFVSYLVPNALVPLLFAPVIVYMTVRMSALDPAAPLIARGSPADLATGRAILSLWQTLLSIVLFFVLWSFLNSMFNFNLGHITRSSDYAVWLVLSSQVIDIGFSLFMLWWILRRKRSIDWTLFWQVAYFVLALALLSISLFGMMQVAQVFLGASAELVFMFLVYFLTRLGRRSAYDPALVVMLGYALISLADWTVRALVSYNRVGLVDGPYVPLFLFLILLTIVFFLPARSPGMQLLTSELADIERGSNLDSTRCTALADEHGLSPRELEVLVLLCRGRSTPYIAETLYLSENTVKTYRRRIYQKLGVHDKQELLDLVERGEG